MIVNLKRDEQFIELLRKRNDLRAKEKLKIEEEEELKKILLDYDKKKSNLKKINHKNIIFQPPIEEALCKRTQN